MVQKLTLRVSLAVLLGALPLAWVAGCRQGSTGHNPSVDATGADSEGGTTVVARGRLQPVDGIINLSGMVGDRVASISAQEGKQYSKGEVLAEFESYPLRAAELDVAETELAEARRRVELDTQLAKEAVAEAEISAEQAEMMDLEINAQRQQVELLESRLRVAENDAKRFDKLDADLISPQEREHKALLLEQARSELASAKALLEKLVKSQDLTRAAAKLKLSSAQANVARVEPMARIPALEANVKLARQKANMARLVAPSDGTVLRISIQPGEMVGQRPIMQFGNLDHMEVVAEVYETEVGRVAKNQSVTITTGSGGALPEPLQGKVVSVGSVVAQNEIMGIDPAERADARVVSVLILVDQPSEAAKQLVNLQVNAVIDTASAPPDVRDAAVLGDRAAHQPGT
ncbi:MAG: HlyD family efflux transporter periplasmic adaptor subunit [Pirellulales bacterium]